MAEFKAAHPDGLVALEWRKGREGDWVLADDGTVMQVLKFGGVTSKCPREYIRTATGTFILSPKTRLDSTFRENIHSFGGRWPRDNRPSARERAFYAYVILGCNPVKAYTEIFKSKNEGYARNQSYLLLGRTSMVSAIRDSIEKAGGKTGATLEWAMGSIKETVDGSVDERVKLKGADMIAEYHGAKGKDTAPQAAPAGAFQGFGEEALPEGEKKQIPEQTQGLEIFPATDESVGEQQPQQPGS